MSSSDKLSALAQNLRIPPQFKPSPHTDDADILLDLKNWKNNTRTALKDILALLTLLKATDSNTLSLKIRGDILFAIVPLSSQCVPDENEDLKLLKENEKWLSHESQLVADEILSHSAFSPSVELATEVLMYSLKPIFKSSPHPHLHGETGRKIPNPAGGSMAMQDYYEEQKWKDYPGVYKLILWCISSIQEDAYERIWHLLIPPVMTLLDDYEAIYKLQGVLIVNMMLRHVPADLLKRTGVDGLLKKSLRSCLSHLKSPETPQLLKGAIKTSVSLTLLTTSIAPGIQPSPARYTELTSLLGEGIISGIWLYAEDKPEAVMSTLEALPELSKALGIGSVRFLKALIPQLAHTLIPRDLTSPDRHLQSSAIAVFLTLLSVCGPRINPWKETILDAIGRCWVGLIDEDNNAPQAGTTSGIPEGLAEIRANVKLGLQNMCIKLIEVCPSVAKEEFPKFLEADKKLFEGLIPTNVIVSNV